MGLTKNSTGMKLLSSDKEKINVKTIEIKTCSNSNERKDLIQDLKKIEVEEMVKQIILMFEKVLYLMNLQD